MRQRQAVQGLSDVWQALDSLHTLLCTQGDRAQVGTVCLKVAAAAAVAQHATLTGAHTFQ